MTTQLSAPCGRRSNLAGGATPCAEYSAGTRYAERRQRPQAPFEGRLAAMRWPERELVFDA